MKKYFLPVLLSCIILLTVNWVFGSETPIQQIIVNPSTHTGQSAENFVTLMSYSVADNSYEFTEDPIGSNTQNYTPYRVPNGYKLVITDFYWSNIHITDWDKKDLVQHMSLDVVTIENTPKVRFVAKSTAVVGSNFRCGASEHMITGFVVNPNEKITASAVADYSNSVVINVILQGYLIGDSTNNSSAVNITGTNTNLAAPTGLPTLTPAVTPSKDQINNSGPWTGVWNVDSLGDLILKQSENIVKGTYNNSDGSIEGIVTENKLAGKWESWFDNGEYEFTLSSDGKSFTGKMKSKNDLRWRTVSGTKKE